MAAFCAFGGREEVRQEDYVILRVAGICPLAVYRERERPMSALAEVLASNWLLVRSEKLVKRLANELQAEQVRDAAVRKDRYLQFHREKIPR